MRQTLLLLAFFSVASILVWSVTFLTLPQEILEDVDARLEARMELSIAAMRSGEPLPRVGAGESASFVPADRAPGFMTIEEQGDEALFRYLTRETPSGTLRLGESIDWIEEVNETLTSSVLISVLLTLMLAGMAGLWLARANQARLNRISDGLARVANGQLDTRIELDGADDLNLVADRINAATARLDRAMTQMRVQSSNIAHDLRTPLARLRADLEASLLRAAEHRQNLPPEVLERALEKIDAISATFDALLRLARIESRSGRAAFTPVALDRLVADVAETFGPVIEDAGQSLEVEIVNAETIQGDRDLLVQFLANLIQNALRHGAPAQTIMLRLHGRRLAVIDQGSGIPESDRERVFEPLFQRAVARQSGGTGLGLSLCRAIAELHNAKLSITDGPDGVGTCVEAEFHSLTNL